MLGSNQDTLQKIMYRAKLKITSSCLFSVDFHVADAIPLAFHYKHPIFFPQRKEQALTFPHPKLFTLNPRKISDDNILLLEKIPPHPQGVVSLHGLQLHIPKTGNISA